MADFNRIFDETTAKYNRGGLFAGAAAADAWAQVFKEMRRRLDIEGATEEQRTAFRNAMLDGIEAAPDSALDATGRLTLRTLVLSAFDGIPRTYDTTVAPAAQFLKFVSFSR